MGNIVDGWTDLDDEGKSCRALRDSQRKRLAIVKEPSDFSQDCCLREREFRPYKRRTDDTAVGSKYAELRVRCGHSQGIND